MSNTVRNALGLLVLAFVAGTAAGAGGLFSSDSGNASVGTAVPFTPPASPTPTPTPTAKPQPAGGLTAQAVHEGGGRIIISGKQRPAESGTRLTVQRRESGGWTDFPAGSTVGADGSYSLWLQTGRKGTMAFRMMDPASGQASNVVRVTV